VNDQGKIRGYESLEIIMRPRIIKTVNNNNN
jgi:hypothetical protein